MPKDREHIIELNFNEKEALIKWLKSPNGAHCSKTRLTFEAVVGGGILVRTMPYQLIEPKKNPNE